MTRDEFMDLVYAELSDDGDNYRANRIIDAADELELESCEDAISRQAAIDIVRNPTEIKLDLALSRLPSVQPRQKAGRWEGDSWLWSCSNCKKDYHEDYAKLFVYCPNCGVKMGGAE